MVAGIPARPTALLAACAGKRESYQAVVPLIPEPLTLNPELLGSFTPSRFASALFRRGFP